MTAPTPATTGTGRRCDRYWSCPACEWTLRWGEMREPTRYDLEVGELAVEAHEARHGIGAA